MVDIHSHIVFGVDDGAKTIEDSLALIEDSYNQGVRKIVATPHYRKKLFKYDREKIANNFMKLRQEVQERYDDVELFLGCEIYCSSNYLEILEKKEFITINGTKYVLVEFRTTVSARDIKTYLYEFLLNGYIPIVAHAERYELLTVGDIEKIIDMGCYIQINSESVFKPKMFFDDFKVIKKRARLYLEKELVHFISSDMHDMNIRRTYMEKAEAELNKMLNPDYVEDIMYNNGEKIINGEEI